MGSNRRELLCELGMLGARPFQHQVVQSPWNPVIDVEELHQPIKANIREILGTTERPEAPRCLTALGPAGYGKTHLLAWTRQYLEQRDGGLFIHVPPYKPEFGPLEQHVLRSTLNSIRLHSHSQRERFERAVRAFLVRQYDAFVDRRRGLRDLKAGGMWRRLLRPSSLKIGSRGPEDQLYSLQRAFERLTFPQSAYEGLHRQTEEHRFLSDSLMLDRDAFIAGSLLACGSETQRWHANAWFMDDRTVPTRIFETIRIGERCEEPWKVLNALFTLQRLVGQTFCIAFDQMEDTYYALQHAGQDGGQLGKALASLVVQFGATPCFCLLFMFQTSVWSDFVRSPHVPRMLRDRMVVDFGAQSLRELDQDAARALVRRRMETFVWRELSSLSPPADEPCFPFTDDDIRKIRREAPGELRGFLQQARQRYEDLLEAPLTRHPLKLLRVEPGEVLAGEPQPVLIHGEHIPPAVEVSFGGGPSVVIAAQPEKGLIEVTTPVRAPGQVPVEVWESGYPDNRDSVMLTFLQHEVPRPYSLHIDRALLKARRRALSLSQEDVAKRIGLAGVRISQLELGGWKNPPDDLFVKLAEIYQLPLSAFERKN